METQKQNFIQRLQNLDDRSKQRVLIGATIVIMVIVVLLWLLYFNTIVASGVGQ